MSINSDFARESLLETEKDLRYNYYLYSFVPACLPCPSGCTSCIATNLYKPLESVICLNCDEYYVLDRNKGVCKPYSSYDLSCSVGNYKKWNNVANEFICSSCNLL